jgi:hypothetical protein
MTKLWFENGQFPPRNEYPQFPDPVQRLHNQQAIGLPHDGALGQTLT